MGICSRGPKQVIPIDNRDFLEDNHKIRDELLLNGSFFRV